MSTIRKTFGQLWLDHEDGRTANLASVIEQLCKKSGVELFPKPVVNEVFDEVVDEDEPALVVVEPVPVVPVVVPKPRTPKKA